LANGNTGAGLNAYSVGLIISNFVTLNTYTTKTLAAPTAGTTPGNGWSPIIMVAFPD